MVWLSLPCPQPGTGPQPRQVPLTCASEGRRHSILYCGPLLYSALGYNWCNFSFFNRKILEGRDHVLFLVVFPRAPRTVVTYTWQAGKKYLWKQLACTQCLLFRCRPFQAFPKFLSIAHSCTQGCYPVGRRCFGWYEILKTLHPGLYIVAALSPLSPFSGPLSWDPLELPVTLQPKGQWVA